MLVLSGNFQGVSTTNSPWRLSISAPLFTENKKSQPLSEAQRQS